MAPGERWVCPSCGKSWDTARVPEAEYRAFVRSLRRAKWLALGGLVAVVAVFVPLVLLVSQALLFPGLVVMAIFYYWFLPSHRKRLRRIYAALPSWEIREGAEDPAREP